MKLKKLFLGLLATAAVLASCQPKEEPLGAPMLNLEPESLAFDANGGEQTIQITATRDWAVSNDIEWLAFDPASGSGSNDAQEIKVTVLANPESNRTYEAQFSIGMITKTLTVSQKGEKGEAALDVTSIADFIKAADGTKVCTLKGTVSNVAKGDRFWGFDINDGTGTVTAAFPANWDSWKDKIQDGGTVVVKGAYEYYDKKGTHQVKKAEIISFEAGEVVPPTEAEAISVAEFIKRADTSKPYRLTGTLENVAKGDRFWGFDINDGTGTVTAAFPANWDSWKDKLSNGGKVTVQGPYEYYEKKGTHQVKKCTIISFTAGEGGGDTPSGPEDPIEGSVFSARFASSMSDFTISNINKPAELDAIWKLNTERKYMIATGYTGGKEGKNLASESALVSPEIDLTSVKEAYLTFEHATNFFKEGRAAEEATCWITKNGKDWNKLAIEEYSNSWDFSVAGNWDLKDYVGSKIQVKFLYKSTAEKAGTWEIRNFAIMKGAYVPGPDPEQPSDLEHAITTSIEWTKIDAAYPDKAYINGGAETVDVLKLGKGKGSGHVELTIPAGTKKIGFYAVGWKDEGCVFTFKKGEEVLGTVDAKANNGASNVSPYKITLSEKDYYEIETKGATKISLTTDATKKRGILIGMNPIK